MFANYFVFEEGYHGRFAGELRPPKLSLRPSRRAGPRAEGTAPIRAAGGRGAPLSGLNIAPAAYCRLTEGSRGGNRFGF